MSDSDANDTVEEPQNGDETPLLDEVAEALAGGRPLDLLGFASALIDAGTRGGGLERIVDSFVDVPVRETTALLAVLSELLDDDTLRRQCRRELDGRNDSLPQWITALDAVDVHAAQRMTHSSAEQEEILLGARLSGGGELTCCVLVDHTLGSAVKDAFLVPAPLASVVDVALQQNTDPETSFGEMSLADARAGIERGIDADSGLEDSDSWPGSRPLVLWLLRHLPSHDTAR
ncbi:hypothetical protein FHR72_001146 [Mycolicibacterium iranicum]|uniref:Uncharacterized protein n=1 Tax=Mycolicibacterium iranicum TaxID=912594 RepID=A0A839Q2N9_MYCIR|nr:hypothetical protein [Mycolicibacterium iranicum]MBB2989683.1 hypothetical protein [Mycolicibacterium iranicum]